MGGKRKREHDDMSELEHLKKREKKILKKIAKLGGKVQAGNMADANDPNKIQVVADVHAPNDTEIGRSPRFFHTLWRMSVALRRHLVRFESVRHAKKRVLF